MLYVMSKKVTRVVIVGGGFGGVKAALNLMNKEGFKVTLISNNTHFEYHGALYRSAVGHSPMEVVIPLREIFEKAKNVELVLDEAVHIEEGKKLLVCASGEYYKYDELILALGSQVNYFNIKGLKENTETMNDISSTIRLRKKLVDLFVKKANKPVRVAIVGAGPSGVELAAELPNFAKLIAKKYSVKTTKLKTILIDSAPRILPILNEKASAKTTKHLRKLGVEINLNITVGSCKPGVVCMSAGNIKADLIVWTAGSKPVDFYNHNPDIFTLGRGGRVVVDECMQAQGKKNIYVLGDNADTKYSGMAQTALNDANYVAKNLIKRRLGKKIIPYRNKRPLYVVTAGSKWAVVQEGERVTSGYRGWLVRRQADLWIFRNFEPYKKAVHTWRQAQKLADF